MYKKLLLFVLLIPEMLLAQSRVISGTIIASDDGKPLPGVNVIVKGSTQGTVSDLNGAYTLSVSPGTVTLVFSSIGFQTLELAVDAGKTTADVTLQSDVKELAEVVVVGYGTQIKQDMTGNIASVSGKAIRDLPVASFDQAIQGRAAGVFVETGNGKLGQGVKVRIRGASSVSASSDPLYVVDGVPITSQNLSSSTAATNPLVDINNNDIESIEVLKDASASAIYGSRAANGVVLITTKRGKTGKTNFNVGYFLGSSQPTNKREWLNTAEYVELMQEARAYANASSVTSFNNRLNGYGAAPVNQPSGVPYASWSDPTSPLYVDNNWEDHAYRDDAGIEQLDISANGGNDKTKFFVSAGYTKQNGILVANSLNRINSRVNLDHTANDRLSFGLSFSLSRAINEKLAHDNAFSTPMQIVALTPMTPVIDPRTGLMSGALNPATGAPNTSYPIYYNPLLNALYSSVTATVFRNFGTGYAAYKLREGLTFRSEFGYDLLTQNEENWYGKETARNLGTPNGSGFNASTLVFNYSTNNYLRFNKVYQEKHNLEAIAGMSYQESNTKYNSVTGQQFPSNAFKKITAAASITAGDSQETAFSFLSYFGRANYKFANKYLVTVSGRVDGSSRFGSDNRYGFFPAASVGWILTEESFMPDSKTLDFLKVRASYGITGNAEIGNFPAAGLYTGSNAGYAGIPGQRPLQIENPDLKWEETAQMDVGIDFGLFESRITGEVDYYVKSTSDLLLDLNLQGATGFRTQTRNVGDLENRGFEIAINTNNLIGDFTWSTNINFARNRNKILNLDGQVIAGSFLSRTQEGEPMGIFFGPKYAGVDPANGDALYEVINVDGSRSTTNDYNLATQQKVGDPNPDIIAGITNTFSYKGVELMILFQGVFGNQVYNGGGKFMSANGDFFDNQTRDQLRRWRNPGDITDVPQARLFFGNGTGESSRYVSDASYVRLRTVTLGYSLPTSILSKVKLTKCRIYVSGQNLLTFTDYNGWDPEVNADTYSVDTAGFPFNTNQGIDFYSAPQPKTVTVGINLGF